MAFTLADLSDMQRRTLAATHLADKTRLTAPQTSIALNRLECLGFVKQSPSPSRAWCITKTGAKLFEVLADTPALGPDKTPDIQLETGIPVTEENQTVAEDILPDMPNPLQYEPDGGASKPHTMSFRAGCGIDYSFTPREAVEADPDFVAPALVTESPDSTTPCLYWTCWSRGIAANRPRLPPKLTVSPRFCRGQDEHKTTRSEC